MSYSVEKVQKLSAEVQAAKVLRDAIVSGAIPLGARLTEISSAEQLGVSRSTIRTAFHQLVQDGLVIQVPYTGWTVMTLSPQDAWELYTLRVSLESLAAGLLAKRIAAGSEAESIRLELATRLQALRKACVLGDRQQIAAEDMALHKAIIALSGHRRLVEQYARIEYQILIYIRSSDALIPEPAQIIAQHQPIIEALLLGDSDAAQATLARHIEEEGAKLVATLENSAAP